MSRRTWTCLVMVIALMGASAAQASSRPTEVPTLPAIDAKALATLRQVAVLHHGRFKPFDSYARETLRLITGSSRLRGDDPMATVLGVVASPSDWTEAKIILVPFVPLRQQLGLEERTRYVSYAELISTKKLMRMLPAIVAKQQREEKLTVLDNETMDLYDRFVAFSGLMQQRLVLVPPADPEAREWRPVLQTPLKATWAALVSAFGRGDAAQVMTLSRRFAQETRQVDPAAYPAPWRLRLEVFYNRIAPFAVARVLYALAAALFLAGILRTRSKLSQPGVGVFLAAALTHAAGILMRVVIGGRPPVSNFFETMLWLPFVAVMLALVFERVYRVGFFGFSASIVSAVMLLLADYVPLDSSISPVVAVLHSNLWLTVHVLTIVASYGALALAAVLAHVYSGFYVARRPASTLKALGTFLYRALQIGVVLLAGGIMLGAVWANASWGRYWGWDPKETWALITLLWFLAVLHGRFAGWLHDLSVALSTISGFFLLLMTYYGVSFYLVGLHSYAGGHAKPLPPLLISYLIAEVIFLVMVGLMAARRRRAA